MIKTIRKLAFAVAIAVAMTCALTTSLTMSFQGTGVLEAAQIKLSSQSSEKSVTLLVEEKPEWRYTRFGWQDANDWATADQIVHPPARRFDNLHPVVLAMLILFSVLASVLWASNEWELAQLMGEPDQP